MYTLLEVNWPKCWLINNVSKSVILFYDLHEKWFSLIHSCDQVTHYDCIYRQTSLESSLSYCDGTEIFFTTNYTYIHFRVNLFPAKIFLSKLTRPYD